MKGTAGGSAMALKEAEGHRGRAGRGAAAERARERRRMTVDATVAVVDFDEEDAWSVARIVVAFLFGSSVPLERGKARRSLHAWKRAGRDKRVNRRGENETQKGKKNEAVAVAAREEFRKEKEKVKPRPRTF